MTKKKNLPKDDLIDQLIGDIKNIPSSSHGLDSTNSSEVPDDLFSLGDVDDASPVGLSPELMSATRIFEMGPEDHHDDEEGTEQKLELPSIRVPSSPLQARSPEDIVIPSDLPAPPPLPGEEELYSGPSADDGPYQGPSADGGYQSLDSLNEPEAGPPMPVSSAYDSSPFESAEGHENEATRALVATEGKNSGATEKPFAESEGTLSAEPTLAANGFLNRKKNQPEPQEKVVIGALRGNRSGQVLTAVDASLAQAENLKLAQQKILDLEKENDRLRQESDEVASAADVIRSRLEELGARITSVEREKSDLHESSQNEIMILKGNLQFKESEVAKARLKIDELEARLKNDFKKIRVKERELENRLELARAEKAALIRAKDENILELKRKIDQQQSEIDNYREKFLELNRTLSSQQEQFKRTVRALRLALANLEAKDENLVPLKKAE